MEDVIENGVKPKTKLFIVKTKMSSSNFVEESQDIGEYEKRTKFLLDKGSRKKVSALRMKYKSPVYSSCLNFHGLYVCGASSQKFISDSMAAATAEFRAVGKEFMENELKKHAARIREEVMQKNGRTLTDEDVQIMQRPKKLELEKVVNNLHADVIFIPLDFQQIFKGSLYAQIGDAINYQVYSGLFERMDRMLKRTEEGKELPEKSRQALIRMVENLKKINVTNDESIDNRLAEFKAKIEKGEIKELAESLKQELDANKNRWEAIEL